MDTVTVMSEPSKPKKGQKAAPKDRGPVLYVRLDNTTEQALQAFMKAQTVEPDRSAVGMKALHEFLAKHGFWPPKPKTA